jgi:hypothetical protein
MVVAPGVSGCVTVVALPSRSANTTYGSCFTCRDCMMFADSESLHSIIAAQADLRFAFAGSPSRSAHAQI